MCIDMLVLWWVKALQGFKHVDVYYIQGETNITWWHGSRQSHRDDLAHYIEWICTYGNHLKRIPTLQGQELSWLGRITHIATRVHNTKCIITHMHASIYIYIYIHHAQCYHTKQESKQTLPTFQGYGLARYRKCKTDIAIPRECGTSKK